MRSTLKCSIFLSKPPPLAVLARAHMEKPELMKKIEVYVDGGITRGTE